MPIRVGSVCSGIEAASVAWGALGWEMAWFAEIEPFPSAVLKHYYPNVPNLGDMTRLPELVRTGSIPAPDILCGGTPCQAFSLSGKRQSMLDDRGLLSFKFVELANEIDRIRTSSGLRRSVVFWENVPGVLSTADNAFGYFLAGLAGEDDPLVPAGKKWTNAGCVFGPQRTVVWRVLDAQFFGLAQRRKRVFVVASAREGFDPFEVLLEHQDLSGDSTESRKEREILARESEDDPDEDCCGDPVAPASCYAIRTAQTGALGHGYAKEIAHTLDRGAGQAVAPNVNVQLSEETPFTRVAATIMAGASRDYNAAKAFKGEHLVWPTIEPGIAARVGGHSYENISGTLRSNAGDNAMPVADPVNAAIRRLTPVECERLMGFPEVEKSAIIRVWKDPPLFDLPSNPVNVAGTPSPNGRKSVGTADTSEFSTPVISAGSPSQDFPEDPEKRVALTVRLESERGEVQIRSQGKLLWCASIADEPAWSPLLVQADDFAQALVHIVTGSDPSTQVGRGGSQVKGPPSSIPLNGNRYVEVFGHGIVGAVNDAERFTSALLECLKFTPSEAGSSSRNYEQTLQTLSSCVIRVIASYIPDSMWGMSSFDIRIETSRGYTNIPGATDAQRYKALGNSWAVNVVRWIGERLAKNL